MPDNFDSKKAVAHLFSQIKDDNSQLILEGDAGLLEQMRDSLTNIRSDAAEKLRNAASELIIELGDALNYRLFADEERDPDAEAHES